MQSTTKKRSSLLLIAIVLLFIGLMALLFFTDNVTTILLLTIFILLFLFSSCCFWLYYVNPDLTLIDDLRITLGLVQNAFSVKDAFLSVRNGSTRQDYFLLKKKPAIKSLFIARDSAVVVQSPSGDSHLLAPGFHQLRRGETIQAAFDLKLQTFIYGTEHDENPFDLKKGGESYTDFHARRLRAQKVRSFTKDGFEVYPSFRIQYQLGGFLNNTLQCEKWMLEFSNYLEKSNLTGEANPHINEVLGRKCAALWSAWIKEIDLQELSAGKSDQNLSQILLRINQAFLDPAEWFERLADFSMAKTTSPTHHNDSEIHIPAMKVLLDDLWIQPEKQTREITRDLHTEME